MIELINKNMPVDKYINYVSRTLLNLISKDLLCHGIVGFQVRHAEKSSFRITCNNKDIDLCITSDIELLKSGKILVDISCEENIFFSNGFYFSREFTEDNFKEEFDINSCLIPAHNLIEALTSSD